MLQQQQDESLLIARFSVQLLLLSEPRRLRLKTNEK